ncbi:MAG TPA: formylglycine-generating enzyme family protein [Polyangia bacterium]
MHKRGLILLAGAGAFVAACGGSSVASNDGSPLTIDDGGKPYVPPDPPPGCTPATQVTQSCANGFCQIPPGCFLVGSPPSDPCRDADETQHWVTLTRAFELAQTEVTQLEYHAQMGQNPAKFTACGGTCPVETVTWHMAAAYANNVSTSAGLAACYDCTGTGATVSCAPAAAYTGGGHSIYDCPGYRLPTEAEFEYAARAGTTTQLYDGVITKCFEADPNADVIGWYIFNTTTNPGPRAVGLKQPNAWGLYDMGGNVEEWIEDGYDAYPTGPVIDPVAPLTIDTSYAARGGSWVTYPKDMRGCDRNQFVGSEPLSYRGFRLARTRP